MTEKKVNCEDCFVLKLCTDPGTLKARSKGPAEIFSQRTGLLAQIEDSQLTRIQFKSDDVDCWVTKTNDYKQVEGIIIELVESESCQIPLEKGIVRKKDEEKGSIFLLS
ncbi:hypothetical protein YC2023_065788 [Brassica napus]